jgi:hypothetical protein
MATVVTVTWALTAAARKLMMPANAADRVLVFILESCNGF